MSNREDLIGRYIENLKEVVGAGSDAELARLLSVDKRTVSCWRARKSIPRKFLDLISGTASAEIATPAMQLSERDKHAFSLALFRATRAQADVASCGRFRDVWDALHAPSGFWLLMRAARADLNETIKSRAETYQTALALVISDDLEDSDGTTKRDRNTLSAASLSEAVEQD